MAEELGAADRALLDFERSFEGSATAKEAAVRARFGLSATRYYQQLYALVETPSALQYDPLLIRRVQRLREVRLAARRVRDQRTAG